MTAAGVCEAREGGIPQPADLRACSAQWTPNVSMVASLRLNFAEQSGALVEVEWDLRMRAPAP